MATAVDEPVIDASGETGPLESLVRRSDRAGVAQLAGHIVALFITGYCVSLSVGTFWWAPALLAHGFVLVFLFAPLHETIHRTAFRSRWMNTAVSWFCGALLVLPPNFFRAFHFAHHRYTQDPERDPELRYRKPTSWRSYLRTVSGIPYWQERLTTTWAAAMGRVNAPFISGLARPGIVREARMLLALYGVLGVCSFAFGSAALIYYWILPAVIGMPFLRMFLLAEHTGCPLVADMHTNSRTALTNAAMRRLAWNMPFHTAHHVYPGVPFHGLPELHRRIRDSVRYEAPGYVAVQREIVRGFPPA